MAARRAVMLGLAALLSLLVFTVAPASAQILLPTRTGFSLGGAYYQSSSSQPSYTSSYSTFYVAATYSRMMNPTWDFFLTYGGRFSNSRTAYTSSTTYDYNQTRHTLTAGGRLHLSTGSPSFDPYVFGGLSYWSRNYTQTTTPFGGSPTTTVTTESGPGVVGGVGASYQLTSNFTLFGNVYGYYYSLSGTSAGTAYSNSFFDYGTEFGASYKMSPHTEVYAMVVGGWPTYAILGFTWSP